MPDALRTRSQAQDTRQAYRPAFNVQFATSTDKQIILGVDVVNTLDPGTMTTMMQQVKENLEKIGCSMPSR